MTTYKNRLFAMRLRFACSGVAHGLRSERSLRTQSLSMLAVLLVLAAVRPAPIWWAIVVFAGTTVLAAELFNTAVERLADHLHPDIHPEIRIVKDCAAAGVLLTSGGAVAVAIALLVELLRR